MTSALSGLRFACFFGQVRKFLCKFTLFSNHARLCQYNKAARKEISVSVVSCSDSLYFSLMNTAELCYNLLSSICNPSLRASCESIHLYGDSYGVYPADCGIVIHLVYAQPKDM